MCTKQVCKTTLVAGTCTHYWDAFTSVEASTLSLFPTCIITRWKQAQIRYRIVAYFRVSKFSRTVVFWILQWNNLWPAGQKPYTFHKYWIWVRGDFNLCIYRSFSSKTQIIAPTCHRRLGLNYEALLCYYNKDISSNSQWSAKYKLPGQLVRIKNVIHKLPFCIHVRVSFCL